MSGPDLSRFTPQRSYTNGVTVYTYSMWGGNGFGTAVERYAIDRDGVVIGHYANGYGSSSYACWVLVRGERCTISSDGETYRGRRIVTRTALSNWTRAVKALDAPR